MGKVYETKYMSIELQDGPIKEHGVNGCKVDDVVIFARDRIAEFNKDFPCRENALVLTKLDEAIMWLDARTKDRTKRGVEGHPWL